MKYFKQKRKSMGQNCSFKVALCALLYGVSVTTPAFASEAVNALQDNDTRSNKTLEEVRQSETATKLDSVVGTQKEKGLDNRTENKAKTTQEVSVATKDATLLRNKNVSEMFEVAEPSVELSLNIGGKEFPILIREHTSGKTVWVKEASDEEMKDIEAVYRLISQSDSVEVKRMGSNNKPLSEQSISSE